MTTTRRFFCAGIASVGLLAAITPAAATEATTVVDMAGREVKLPALPKRIVLLEAGDILTMSLLHPDPASLVIGWAAVDRIDSDLMRDRLMNGHSVATVGKLSPDTLSLEGLIALQPDLIVTTAFMTPDEGDASLIARLKQVGIPVVFSDASSNVSAGQTPPDPLSKLKASMTMWGTLLGAGEKAKAFVSFFEHQLADIKTRLAGATPVTTYLEVQSTLDDCCWAAGTRNWGELLALAGGKPLPGVKAPWFEKLSLEYVLATPQDVYIASGGGWSVGGRPEIGPGIDPERGRKGLQKLVDGRAGFKELESVRNKRVYGIWTGLISNLPLNILFVATAAKWLHPDRCADLDPTTVLATINRDFAAFPIDGPLWTAI
jgi:iron complex transport system substrate-binding protein